MKFSVEEQEELKILFNSNGWNPFIKFLGYLETDRIKRLLTYDLSSGPDGLVIEKARTEGVQRLIKRIETERNKQVRG